MISEYVKYLDVFSQSFQFNTGKIKDRKRTYLGAFLTFSIMILQLHKLIQINTEIKKSKNLTHSAELLENSIPIFVPNFNTKRSIQLTYPQDTDNQKVQEDFIIEQKQVEENQSPIITPDCSIKTNYRYTNQQDQLKESKNEDILLENDSTRRHLQKQLDSEQNRNECMINEDQKIDQVNAAKNYEFRLKDMKFNNDNKLILNINQKKETQAVQNKQQKSISAQMNVKNYNENSQMPSLQIQSPLTSCRESLRNNQQNNYFQENERGLTKQNKNNQRQTQAIQIAQSQNDENLNNIENNQASQSNLDQKLKYLNNQTLLKKLEQILFKFNIFKKSKFMQDKGMDQQTFLSIQNEVNRSLDYSQIYQEIMLCKKAIMMILSQEQFAALRFVGCSDQFSQAISSQQNDYSLNHFEKQFATQLIQKRQAQQINSFIQRCSQNNNLSAIDERIYQSLI
ncbi:hypothetical protein ABPG73_007409 [Tetrahymena malaccensis]